LQDARCGVTYRVDTVERSYDHVHSWLSRKDLANWKRAAEFALAAEHAGLPIPYVSRLGNWCVRLVFGSGVTDAVVEFLSEPLVLELPEHDHVTVEQDDRTVDIWSDMPVCESVERLKRWMT
jgi:hypothetical protein